MLSARTAVVQATPTQPSSKIQLPSGETSVTVSSSPKDERMIVSQVRFEPSIITSRTEPIAIRFFVKASRTGDPPLAGVAGYRLVEVITRPQ